MPSSEITELTSLVRDLISSNQKMIIDTSDRTTRIEVNFENMVKAVEEVSLASKSAIASMTNLDKKIVSLEDRAINKLNLVEDTVNENSAKIDLIDKRTYALEAINANNIGKAQGAKEVKEENHKKATNNWTRILSVIGVILTIVGLAYKFTGEG